MSFGKVKEAVRALDRDGKLPPHLKPGERNKRIYDRLVELGYDPRSEMPSRRSLARYLERLSRVDATRPLCPLCHVHRGGGDGISGDDLEHEEDDGMEA